MNAEQKKASFVKRARVSANAGPYLFLAGVVLAITGYALGALHIGIMAAMGVAAVILQAPRQKAWRTQSDALEFASLAAMPILLVLFAIFWLRPEGTLSLSTILQGLGGFFLVLGIFHTLTKAHTLRLADEIEQQ